MKRLMALFVLSSMAPAVSLSVQLSGAAYSEGDVERYRVVIWDRSPETLRQPGRLVEPLFDRVIRTGRFFSVDLEDARLPVQVELSAQGHVSLSMLVATEEQSDLPIAWLQTGRPVSVLVERDGQAVDLAWVSGRIRLDEWAPMPTLWQACIPHTQVTDQGRALVFVPPQARLVAEAWSDNGAWGRLDTVIDTETEELLLDLDSEATSVLVQDRDGRPVPGAMVAATGSPIASFVRTNADGRTSLHLTQQRPQTVVALSETGARSVEYGEQACNPLVIDLASKSHLEVRWPGDQGPIVLQPDWLPISLQLGYLVTAGGVARLPFWGSDGVLTFWGSQTMLDEVVIAASDRTIDLDLEATTTLSGEVRLENGRPAAGVPIWAHWPSSENASVEIQRPWQAAMATDFRGHFYFMDIGARFVSVEASSGDWRSLSSKLKHIPGHHYDVHLRLGEESTLSLWVVDPSGAGLSGVEVSVLAASVGPESPAFDLIGPANPDDLPLASTLSDHDGNAVLSHLPIGPARVYLRCEGWVSRTLESIEIRPGHQSLGDVVLEPGITLRGRTVDERGKTVAHSDVALDLTPESARFDVVARSDAEGRFTVLDLPQSGEIFLKARADGYVPLNSTRISPPYLHEVDVELTKSKALAGVVIESRSAAPITGAKVSIIRLPEKNDESAMSANTQLGLVLSEVSSNDRGEFSLTDLREGAYSLSVSAKTYQPSSVSVTIGENSLAQPVIVELERGYQVDGVVLSSDGEPVADAKIMASPTGPSPYISGAQVPRTTSGRDGRFSINGLAGEQYTFVACARNGAAGRQAVDVISRPFVEIRLDAPQSISGWVFDPTGARLAGIRVTAVSHSQGNGFRAQVRTAADGSFRIRGTVPGDYVISATSEGWLPATENVRVIAHQDAEVELHF